MEGSETRWCFMQEVARKMGHGRACVFHWGLPLLRRSAFPTTQQQMCTPLNIQSAQFDGGTYSVQVQDGRGLQEDAATRENRQRERDELMSLLDEMEGKLEAAVDVEDFDRAYILYNYRREHYGHFRSSI